MHVKRPSPCDFGPSNAQVSQNVFVLWTGRNEMSSLRKDALSVLQKHIGVHVTIVTPDNLASFLIDPLPDNYEYLSEVHKSDVLRCYLMHFWGGGYCDIKHVSSSWEHLTKSPDLYVIGTRECKTYCFIRNPYPLDCFLGGTRIICGNQMICKRQTPFTTEWYIRMRSRLSAFPTLKETPPVITRDHRFYSKSKYPIRWEELLGEFFGQLSYEYRRHISPTLPKFNYTKHDSFTSVPLT